MAFAQKYQHWLFFKNLDSYSQLDGAFTVGYRITSGPVDGWTTRFTNFKFGPPRSRIAGNTVMSTAVQQLMAYMSETHGVAPHEVTFMPVLGSSETKANPSGALTSLALACSKACGCAFRMELLSKNPHPSLHGSSRTAEQRAAIIRDAGYTASVLGAPVVVIFDDFITRGDTLGSWADAIKAANSGVMVYAVALAKNEGYAYLPDPATANAHIPSELAQMWDEQERG